MLTYLKENARGPFFLAVTNVNFVENMTTFMYIVIGEVITCMASERHRSSFSTATNKV